MNSESIIEVEGLVKKFGAFTAVNGISFSVKKGEIFGFLGANGAGKTTAIKMLNGLLKPTSGKAAVAGFDVFTQAARIRENIGYMSQRFSLYEDLTVKENFRFYAGIYGLQRRVIAEKTDELLRKLDFMQTKNQLIGSLPLGWKQKLAFSLAIFHNPKVVFLDEPTSGVDPVTRRQFWEMIYDAAEQGITIFVTTHYMDEAEYCDRISIMVDGRIDAMDTPAALREKFNALNIDEVFLKLARPAAINAQEEKK
ncbi:MAG TPA: ABC transporter ATP-binding protein [Chitinophagales bacterium]|nr:ABC transporter ATP-binding protein [Chitinophagales bacterium]